MSIYKEGSTVKVLPSYSVVDKLYSENLIEQEGVIVREYTNVDSIVKFKSNLNGMFHTGYGLCDDKLCWIIPNIHLGIVTKPKFKEGDKVIVDSSYNPYPLREDINKNHTILIGHTGRVIVPNYNEDVLVEFKKNINGIMHNGVLPGSKNTVSGKDDRCWFISEKYLTLVPEKKFKLGDRVIVKPKYVCMRYTEGYDPIIIGLTGVVILEGDTYYNVRIGDIAYRIHKKLLKLEVK